MGIYMTDLEIIEYKRLRDRKRERERRIKNPSWSLWYSAKRRAKKKGFKFTIDVDDIVIPKICPVLGIPIKFRKAGVRAESCGNHPSIERLNSNKGYIKSNILVVSWRANWVKGSGTPGEIKAWYEFFKSRGYYE